MPTNLSTFLGSTFVGNTGSQGTQGLQGQAGTSQGLQGLQGTQGAQGIQGVQGLQGIQGVQATQGLQGLQGLQGTAAISTLINATEDTTSTLLYPVMVNAIGSNQTVKASNTNPLVFNALISNLGIGTTNPTYTLSCAENTSLTSGLTGCIADFSQNTASFGQVNIRNASNNANASSDYIVTADTGTDTTNYVDLGINNSAYSVAGWTINGALDGYLYTSDTNFSVGTAAANKYLSFFTGGTLAANERVRITGIGSVGVGVVAPSALLNLNGGTTAANTAPLKINSGSNLTTAEAGAVEYDGVRFYATADTTSGRGFIESTQIYRLTADAAAGIGTNLSVSFFGTAGGAGAAINLAAGGVYRLEAYCYFTKTTAQTVTFNLTTSQTAANIDGIIRYGAITGGTATGAANQIALFKSAGTSNAFGASGSLSTGVNHAFCIEAIIEANATLASTLTINVISNVSGTVTPLRGSYYIVTRLPGNNQGSFV